MTNTQALALAATALQQRAEILSDDTESVADNLAREQLDQLLIENEQALIIIEHLAESEQFAQLGLPPTSNLPADPLAGFRPHNQPVKGFQL